jgi:hypothetical protein
MTVANAIPLPPLLELTSNQLQAAVQNASEELERLAGSVAAFVRLGAEMRAHPDPAIAAHGARVAAEAERALFAMQFHDPLVQRLRHVSDSLADLRAALAAPTAPPMNLLLAVIRARYTMEDERRLFDVMLERLPDAQRVPGEPAHDSPRGSIELF